MKFKIVILAAVVLVSSCSPFHKYNKQAKNWANDIKALELKDKNESDPKDAILFVGSSSVRLWDNIKNNMAPYAIIQRGYGGAKFSDLNYYIKRIVYPHQFKALAIFVANDITGDKLDKTPQETILLVNNIVQTVRAKYKNQAIFIIGITPTPSRWAVWDKSQELNRLMKLYCEKSQNLHFIATQNAFLAKNGKPLDGIYREDNLHLNQKGYDIWASVIKKSLSDVLK